MFAKCLVLCMSLASSGVQAVGKPPSIEPQLRVAQEMHGAPIGQVRAEASFSRMFTISADKTVRIWRLSDLRLLRTVHLPSENGPEGTPHALAVDGPGKRVWAAGVTGWHWFRAVHIYLIDGELGQVVKAIGHFDNDTVMAMDLAPDGKRLAVGLARGGLHVIDPDDGTTLQSDAQYGGGVTFVHFARDGRLATTSSDGCVRVYGPDLHLQFRNQYPPVPSGKQCTGSDLGGIRFSPDGSLLAFGTRNRGTSAASRAEVVVLDAASLAMRRVVGASAVEQESLCCIAWAADSHTLYVNGNVATEGRTPIYRLRDPLRGSLERWDVGERQIANMLPLPGGQIVLATTAPSLVKVGADGAVARRPDGKALIARTWNEDFYSERHRDGAFRLSRDGASIAFARPGRSPLRVDVTSADPTRVINVEGALDPDLYSPRRQGRVRVETDLGIYAYRKPTTVGGFETRLESHESVWSWSVHAERAIATLGTQWHIRVVDSGGQPLPAWHEPPYIPAPAYHTAITEDGRTIVAALGDGTVRWYDIATGRERLGLFVHANGADWVAWRPDGHYASSPDGDSFIGWLINRGAATDPDFYRAVQFERTLYRPDLIRAAFDDGPSRSLVSMPLSPRLLAPRVKIEAVSPQTREVRFAVDPRGETISEIGVFADGIPVLDAASRRTLAAATPFVRTVRIPDGLRLDVVRVEAESAQAIGLDEAAATRPVNAAPRPGKLWVLAIGVEVFDDFAGCGKTKACPLTVPPLPNAPSDARALAARLGAQRGRGFADVSVTLVGHRVGPAPTKAAIVEALQDLQRATAEDTVLVFLASHGVAGGPGGSEYYFMPSDAAVAAVEAVLKAAEGRPLLPGSAQSLLSASELSDALRRVAGRRILIIDTCHAGAADGRANPHSLAKRSASAQVAVLSAANGNEKSYEHADINVPHGAFTHALLRGLEGAADVDRDGSLTLDEAFRYVGPEVGRNMDRINAAERARDPRHRNLTQTPALHAPPVLRSSRLSADAPATRGAQKSSSRDEPSPKGLRLIEERRAEPELKARDGLPATRALSISTKEQT